MARKIDRKSWVTQSGKNLNMVKRTSKISRELIGVIAATVVDTQFGVPYINHLKIPVLGKSISGN